MRTFNSFKRKLQTAEVPKANFSNNRIPTSQTHNIKGGSGEIIITEDYIDI